MSLWLFNFYTKKWRGTCLDILSQTAATIQECKIDEGVALNDMSGSFDASIDEFEGLFAQKGATVKATKFSGPLEACTGLAWFGEHSLILITKRRSRFCLEIITREVNKDSLHTGRPVPVVHRILPLPPGWKPTLMSVKLVRKVDPPCSACIIALSNGVHILQFHVLILMKNVTNKSRNLYQIDGYEVTKVMDVSINQMTRQSDTHTLGISLPIRRILTLPPTSNSNNVSALSMSSHAADMCALDSKGQCFYLTKERAYQLMDSGPFKDIKLCDESFHIDSSSDTSTPKQVTAIILVSSRLTGSKYCLIPNELHQPSSLLHVLSFPLESIPSNAVILGHCHHHYCLILLLLLLLGLSEGTIRYIQSSIRPSVSHFTGKDVDSNCIGNASSSIIGYSKITQRSYVCDLFVKLSKVLLSLLSLLMLLMLLILFLV